MVKGLFSNDGSLREWWDRLARAISPRRRLLAQLREGWGKPGTKDGWLADRYFELARAESVSRYVDDRTWVDLEFPSVFANMDTTVTQVGRQYLFRQMRTYLDDSQLLLDNYELYETFRANTSLREATLLKLAYLQSDSSASIIDCILGKPLENLKHRYLIFAWSVASLAALTAVLASTVPGLFLLPFVLVNAVAVLWLAPRLFNDTDTLKACYRLLRVADGLSDLHTDVPIHQLAELRRTRADRVRFRRALKWFALSQENLVFGSLGIWLNFLCLGELVAYVLTVEKFRKVRGELLSTFDSVGSLDAAIAISSFLERTGTYCKPDTDEGALIDITDGYHPLLADPVPNSVTLRNSSALICGSNMAGKTTFIKMIGTNIVLGQTLGFCLASHATIPRFMVMACIRSDHSIESGKSHYFVQIEAVLSFLSNADSNARQVFVIDELLSGTNTIERIAWAKAILSALSEHAPVLVTTHDVELQTLLSENFDLFHFSEDPDIEGFFDYKVRKGLCNERNAIRLLDRIGFPEGVVNEAMAIANRGRTREPT